MTARLERLLRTISGAALLLLLALVVVQVVMRYQFDITPFFTEELARYLLVWSVMAGAAVSILADRHIRVTILPDLLRPNHHWFWMRALDFLTFALLAVLTHASVQTVRFAEGQTSDGLQVSLQYPYAILPVAFGMGLVFLSIRITRSWRERPWKTKE